LPFFFLETGSLLDSLDVSFLNDIHYQQHQRRRRRIESASDIDDRSMNSDDVGKIYLFLVNIFF